MSTVVEQAGVLRIKAPGKRGLMGGTYSAPVECWLRNNVLTVALPTQQEGRQGGTEEWDLKDCKVVIKDKKLDRFDLLSLTPQQPGTMREAKFKGESSAATQTWIRNILVSQHVFKAKAEADSRMAEGARRLQDKFETHIQGLEDQLQVAKRAAEVAESEALELRRRVEGAQEEVMESAKDSQAKLMEIEVERVGLRGRLEAVQLQLSSLQERVSSFQTAADHHEAEAEAQKQRADSAVEKLHLADATARDLQQLLDEEKRSREELQGFVILQNHQIHHCLNDFEKLVQWLAEALEKEVEDRQTAHNLIEWVNSSLSSTPSGIMPSDSSFTGKMEKKVALRIRDLAALQQKQQALELKVGQMQRSQELMNEECANTMRRLTAIQAHSAARSQISIFSAV